MGVAPVACMQLAHLLQLTHSYNSYTYSRTTHTLIQLMCILVVEVMLQMYGDAGTGGLVGQEGLRVYVLDTHII